MGGFEPAAQGPCGGQSACARMFVLEADAELFDTPPWMLATQSEKRLLPPRAMFLWAALGPARKFLETFGTARAIPCQPLITGRGADRELPAEFAEIDFRLHGQGDEMETLLMRGRSWWLSRR